MKETVREIAYKSYVDYGLIFIVAIAAIAGLWFLLKYTKASRDKYIAEKEAQIKELRIELAACREQSNQMGRVIAENSVILGEVKGILLILNEKLK